MIYIRVSALHFVFTIKDYLSIQKHQHLNLVLLRHHVPAGEPEAVRVTSRHSVRVQGLDRYHQDGQVYYY